MKLRDVCREWAESDIKVLISNSDTEFIRDLYRDFHVHEISAARSINSDGKGRGKVQELLIMS